MMPAAKTAQTEVETKDGEVADDRVAALEVLIRQQAEQIDALQTRPAVVSKPDYPEPLGLRPKGERQEHGREILTEWEREAREAEKDAE